MRGRGARLVAVAAVLATALAIASATAGAGATPAPVISGEAREGEVLSASSTSPPDSWAWQRCSRTPANCDPPVDRGGSTWTNIPGASGPGADSYLLTSADVNHFVRVLAVYFTGGTRGSFSVPSEPVGPVAAALGGPPPPGPPGPPVARVSANLNPVSGTVFILVPGDDTFRPLTGSTQIPLGTIVDARDGHVEVITARNLRGELQSGEFWDGAFKLTQTEGTPLVTRLKLVGLEGRRSARAQRGGQGARRLWGRGRCRCRTGGRHSSATVRGTWWLTVDRRRSTLTKVKRGSVKVRDFALRETVRVRAGERYVAEPGGN